MWYEGIVEEGEKLYLKDNFREDASYYTNIIKKPLWAKRALKMDEAIQTALKDKLVVRAIICSGQKKKK